MLDRIQRTTSLVVESLGHADRISIVIEQKAANEAKALANAVTPEVEAAFTELEGHLKTLTEKLASLGIDTPAEAMPPKSDEVPSAPAATDAIAATPVL